MTNLARFDWSAPAIARLGALWGAGYSAAQVATVLGEEFSSFLTRNAVLGQVHRSGLTRDVPALPVPVIPLVVPEPAPAPAPVWPTFPEDGEVVPAAGGYRLEDVPLYGCKWPVTKHLVAPSEHRFCGARARTGKSYCAHHHGIAYRPAPSE